MYQIKDTRDFYYSQTLLFKLFLARLSRSEGWIYPIILFFYMRFFMKFFRLTLIFATCSFAVSEDKTSIFDDLKNGVSEILYTSKTIVEPAINKGRELVEKVVAASPSVSPKIAEAFAESEIDDQKQVARIVQQRADLMYKLNNVSPEFAEPFAERAKKEEEEVALRDKQKADIMDALNKVPEPIAEAFAERAKKEEEEVALRDKQKADIMDALNKVPEPIAEAFEKRAKKEEEEVALRDKQKAPASFFDQSRLAVSEFVGNNPYAITGTVVIVAAAGGVYFYQKKHHEDKDAKFEQD